MSEAAPPFAPGVYTGAGATARLIGSRCGACGATAFPRQDVCPHDGGAMANIELPRTGTLYSATVVRVKPPFGLPRPYAVGYVDLDWDGLRVFALLDPLRIGDYAIGMRLAMTSGPMGVDLDGAPCERPYFTPAES